MIEEPNNTTSPDEQPEGTQPEAAEPTTPEAPAAEAPAATAEAPAEPTDPKERRRQARSRHTGEARPTRTPDERATERAEKRRSKAAARRRWRARQRAARGGGDGPARTPPAREHGPGRPRERQGLVVSSKADKTITVRIDTARQHRVYKKIVRSSSMLHAHDERNEANAGDTVRVVESRPLSRTKRWRLVEVLERAR